MLQLACRCRVVAAFLLFGRLDVLAHKERFAIDGFCLVQVAQEVRVRGLAGDAQRIGGTRDPRPSQETLLPTPWIPVPGCQRKENAVIIWVHLHNVAGTWMCGEAKAQGELSTFMANCQQGFDICGNGMRVGCEDRVKAGPAVDDADVKTFTAIERALDRGDLTCYGQEHVVYGTMLRDPLSQVRSFLASSGMKKAELINAIQTRTPTRRRGPFEGAFGRNTCLPVNDNYQHVDNFATRTLSGAYNNIPGNVSRKDLEAAKRHLERMDVVLILEDLQQHVPQLNVSFCWDAEALLAKDRLRNRKSMGTQGTHTKERLKNMLTEEEEGAIRGFNALDYELYEFAKQLAAKRTARASAILEETARASALSNSGWASASGEESQE